MYNVLAFDKLPVTLWHATELITTELDAKQKKKKGLRVFLLNKWGMHDIKR